MDDLVLAIDIGTSSSRAIVVDTAGCAIDGLRAQVHYEPRIEPEGASEFEADFLVESVAKCIDEVMVKVGRTAGRIRAVGTCTFWHSMVGVDSGGIAVTPLYTWADTRSKVAAAELASELDPSDYHGRTGCAIHTSYFPARLRWLHAEQPDVFRRVKQWISPGEYLYSRLFGRSACSVSMASATGLFDQNLSAWDELTLGALPISRDQLPDLVDVDSPSSGLTNEWARRWPELANIPWTPAIGDGASSNIGSGCSTDRQIAINLGTSGAIRTAWTADAVTIPPELWCYRVDGARFVMGGAFSDGGSDYAWLRQTLKLPDSDEAVEEALTHRQPFEHGLTFLPFLSGERSIGWRPDARATIHGLRHSTTPLDLVQAAMESVALRFALVASVLLRQFPDASEIRASGGALAQSPLWARMICDAIGKPISVITESEASSRGAAIMAMRSVGIPEPDDSHIEVARALIPDPDRHQRFIHALETQQDLYGRLMTF